MLFRVFSLLLLVYSVLAAEFAAFNPDISHTHHKREPRASADAQVDVVFPELPRTNAGRLARGLPPLKPKFKQYIPGRINVGPSRVEVARGYLPSVTPDRDVDYHGRIVAFDENGEQLGYVFTDLNVFGEYGLTADTSAALEVHFKAKDSGGTRLNIYADNSDFPASFFAGVLGFSSTNSNLGPGSSNYAYLSGSEQTSPGSPPTNVRNSFTAATLIPEQSESAIWTFDASTHEIKAQWINTHLEEPVTAIGYTQDVLLLTGDFKKFAEMFGPSQLVTLRFAPL